MSDSFSHASAFAQVSVQPMTHTCSCTASVHALPWPARIHAQAGQKQQNAASTPRSCLPSARARAPSKQYAETSLTRPKSSVHSLARTFSSRLRTVTLDFRIAGSRFV
eukprot:4793038-Pleurochrysis_carterae.AAC.12